MAGGFQANYLVIKKTQKKPFKKITAKLKLWFAGLLALLVLFAIWQMGGEERALRRAAQDELNRVTQIHEMRKEIAKQLGPQFAQNQYPTETDFEFKNDKRAVKIQYSINPEMQQEAMKLLKSYKPDYGAIVMMDALTGEVLAIASYQKGSNQTENLALRNSYPAASVFKIITATAALDKYKMEPDTLVMFNGSNHTLYRKNVLFTKVNRWTREITLREAFARSINTVFGRLTFEHMQPKDLEEYAIRFGFNKPIQSDLPFDSGFTQIPNEKNYELAEIASGYNRITTMSPIQGAMIAASVANNGVMRVPSIVRNIKDLKDEVLFKSEPVTAAVTMTGEGAERLRELMEATITQGTSRKSFRALVRDRKLQELELGGKTGSLTGKNPKGKVDWFVGYAIGGEKDRIAVGAITVNVNYWTMKSSFLAQSMFKKHFKDQFSARNEKFFNASHRDDQQ